MRRFTLGLILLLAAFSARAAEETAKTTKVYLPVAGTILGYGNWEWRTAIALRNDLGRDVDVLLTMTAAPGQPFLLTTIPDGETLRYSDVAREIFGTTEIVSPLLIETVADRSVAIGAAVYAVNGSQVSEAEPLPLLVRPPGPATHLLNNIVVSSKVRTNVGFGNLGERDAVFVVALQRFSERPIASTTVRVPPRSLVQLPFSALFPLAKEVDGWMIVVDPGAPDTYSYASTIDNATSNGHFVEPLPGYE